MKKEILILLVIIGSFALIQSLNFVKPPNTTGSPLIRQTDDRNFYQHMDASKDWVLLEFWAPWCPHCRKLKPTVNELADEMQEHLTILGINKDEAPGLAHEFRVEGIPCLILLYKGREVERKEGALPKAVLTHWINTTMDRENGSGK